MITVAIAVYNVAKYLEKCIESVLEQTYDDYEVIIVDDGSTDGSEKIADRYAKLNPKIEVIHKVNGGLSSVRQESIKKAKGDYILMIDGDDYILPCMLERMYKYLVKYNADIVVCGYFTNEISSTEKSTSKKEVKLMEKSEFMPLILFDEIQAMVWNKLIKKSCLKDVVFPDKMIAQDIGTMHYIFDKAEKILLIDDKLYVYRDDCSINPNNTTNGNAKAVRSSYHRAIHFENRLIFADENYPECSDNILNIMARFYIASYLKASYYHTSEEEKENARNKLIFYKKRLSKRAGVELKVKILSHMIIKKNYILSLVSLIYMRKRKFI